MLDQRLILIAFLVIFVLLFVISIIYIGIKLKNIKYIKEFANKTKCFVINLEKNVDRLQKFIDVYTRSDITIINLERFNAVNGKSVNLEQYVTPLAYDQIITAEKNGYRFRHYELTRGAVGCFLSHITLYNKLLNDNDHDFYLIFEDDAYIPKNIIKELEYFIEMAPPDWDILVFGVIREVISESGELYDKVKTWWGLFGYAINKKGAERFMNEFNEQKKIDKQIDSMMSMMINDNKLNVYSSRVQLISHNSDGSDIQLPIQTAFDIDPFKYKNIELYTNKLNIY